MLVNAPGMLGQQVPVCMLSHPAAAAGCAVGTLKVRTMCGYVSIQLSNNSIPQACRDQTSLGLHQ